MNTEANPTQFFDFSGKLVLVTGGGSGIGAEIARRFALAGARVAVCDLHASSSTAAALQALGKPCLALAADVTQPDQVRAMLAAVVAEWGAPDVLVNNAGIYPMAGLLDMTPAEWQRTIDVDLTSVFLCTQAAARAMRAAGKGGAVINIASIEAVNPASGHAHYGAAKAGVIAFTKAAAQELGPHGIRVNALSPGLVDRPNLAADWPDGYTRFVQKAPLGRVGQPVDVADACLFLASDAARWVSGAHLVVDGGILSGPAF